MNLREGGDTLGGPVQLAENLTFKRKEASCALLPKHELLEGPLLWLPQLCQVHVCF